MRILNKFDSFYLGISKHLINDFAVLILKPLNSRDCFMLIFATLCVKKGKSDVFIFHFPSWYLIFRVILLLFPLCVD